MNCLFKGHLNLNNLNQILKPGQESGSPNFSKLTLVQLHNNLHILFFFPSSFGWYLYPGTGVYAFAHMLVKCHGCTGDSIMVREQSWVLFTVGSVKARGGKAITYASLLFHLKNLSRVPNIAPWITGCQHLGGTYLYPISTIHQKTAERRWSI